MNKKIIKENIIKDICEIYPSFKTIVDTEYSEEKDLIYVIIGRFAKYLLDLYIENKDRDFSEIARYIEDLHLQKDRELREIGTIGFLEGIQNIWENNNIDPEIFYQYLLPESKKWWLELNRFWDGEVKYVGESFAKP